MSTLTALVTGGTGALGAVVVETLLAEGWNVAVPYRDQNGFAALRALAGHDRIFGSAVDAADPEAMTAFVHAATGHLGPLGALAHLAGAFRGSPRFEEAPRDEWDDMLRANLQTAYAASRAALPPLRTSRGAAVFIGSRLVEQGGGGAAAYAVSKAAVVALTRALAVENAGTVRVNCVLPGTIDTPANRQAMPTADRSSWTSPQAIAQLIAFLLSPRSGALTGAVLPLHGGPPPA